MLDTIMELAGNEKLVATVVLGIIALAVILPQYIRGRQAQPEKKRMRRKTKAEVTKTESSHYLRDEGEIWVNYVFTVDGKEYTGCGRYIQAEYELFPRITVFYDPENPAKNCTSLTRAHMGTTGAVLWFWVIVGILVLVWLFVE